MKLKAILFVFFIAFGFAVFPQPATTINELFYNIPFSDSKECIFGYLRSNKNFIEEKVQEPGNALRFDEYFGANISNPLLLNRPDSSFIYASADRIEEISGQLVSNMNISFNLTYYFKNKQAAKSEYHVLLDKLNSILKVSGLYWRNGSTTQGKVFSLSPGTLILTLDTFDIDNKPNCISLQYPLPKSLYPTNTVYLNGYCQTYSLFSDLSPEFAGGKDSLVNFIKQHQQKSALLKTKGYVYVDFFVNSNGEIIDPKIIDKSVDCAACNDEALRIIKLMPKWVPGKQKSYNNLLFPVLTQTSLSFKFDGD